CPCPDAAEAATSMAMAALRHARPIGGLQGGPFAPTTGGSPRATSAVGQVADVPDVVGLQDAGAGEAHGGTVRRLDEVEALTGRAVERGLPPVHPDAEEFEGGGPRVQLDLLGNADDGGEPAQRTAGVVAANAGGEPLEGGGHLYVAPSGHLPVAEALALGGAVRDAERGDRKS